MKLIIIIFAILLVHNLQATDFLEESGVLVLNDKNFDKAISTYEFILVEFYAPWCDHCKKFAPEYEKAAQKLKKDTPYIPLAKVDCTAEKETADKYDIQGFPTLKFFINGTPIEYSGGRTEDEIIQWIKKKSGTSSVEILTQEGLNKIKNDNPVTVVYFAEDQGHPSYNEFMKVSKQYDSLIFAHVINSQLAKDNEAETPSIVLFKNFDEKRNDYKGSFLFDHIINFIEQNQYQTIMNFDEKTAEMIFTGNKAVLFLVFSKGEQSQQNSEAQKTLENISDKLKGQILMCTADFKEELGEKLVEYLGLIEKELPKMLIIQVQDDNIVKYLFKGQYNEQEILAFYNDFKNEKLQPFLKSDEPYDQNDGSITIVVGRNFDEIVKDESKDVLVFFYAPWCTHCQQLQPIYEKLGEKIKASNHKILLTKIDATSNEVAGIQIDSFPTIKLFPTNNKKSPIDYDGDRTEEALIKFLKDHATVPWVDLSSTPSSNQQSQQSSSQTIQTQQKEQQQQQQSASSEQQNKQQTVTTEQSNDPNQQQNNVQGQQSDNAQGQNKAQQTSSQTGNQAEQNQQDPKNVDL